LLRLAYSRASLWDACDSAYIFSVILFVVGGAMAFAKGEFGGGCVLIILAVVLLPCRHHFYRKASWFSQPLNSNWVLTYVVIIGMSLLLVSFSYKHVEYTSDLWWQFTLKGDASRSLRGVMGAGVLMGLLMLSRLFAPIKAKQVVATPEELLEIEAIVAASPSTEANLALLGDKSFLMSDSGKSFIMYGVKGDSWIAMGDPVGDPSEFDALLWKFRELSDGHNDRAVCYEISTDYLPLYLDAGFSLTKIGEEAIVPLTDFSLEGSARKGLRSTISKVERGGCSFEIIPRESVAAIMPELKAISDQWLGDKSGAEKGFSLGCFSEPYLCITILRWFERMVKLSHFVTYGKAEERKSFPST
jgi:phosphatidylglycerol lysyltransferase